MASSSDEASLAENPLPCYISSIPPEILSQIMLMCDRDLNIWDETCHWEPAGHNIPVRLTQICSSWRSLALDTRELWSSVTLVLNQELAQNPSAITEFAHYWLAKGQRNKLALKIDMCSIYSGRVDLKPIGQLLTAWASDWRTLIIANCPDSMAEHVIAKMAQSIYPSLEEFELHAFSIVWHSCFEALAALPRLRAVSFRIWGTQPFHHELTLLFLPWSQLESVSISAPVSGHECLDVLQNCPELTTLELYVVSDVPDPESRRTVTLSKLSRLRLVAETLWDHDTNDIESFLGVLPYRYSSTSTSISLAAIPGIPSYPSFGSATLLNCAPWSYPTCTSGLIAPDFDALRVEQLLPALTRLDVAVGHERGVEPIDSVRSAIALLEARTTATTGIARLAQVTFADWTDWDQVDRDLNKADPVAMAVELQRLRALEAQGMDVHWMVGRHDVLASGETPIRYSSIHS
ncbi:F-box domain-containing protein [Mycena sanguinolenta]|uniref:F-box domain-containing protein n=1 Tax=Mycena sanguinolenta TaxID=230812 RepID=A0A8H6Y3K7_9AGAR|nr:F-box domain-containing protein [Mycena sanguinolenta]